MRFFYVTIFALSVEGADCTDNQLCSTKCKCKDADDCEGGKKVCIPGTPKELITLTADNQLKAGENANATKHLCVSAAEKKVFKCVFKPDGNAENEACNPHGVNGTVDQANVCLKSNTVLKAGNPGVADKLCIGKAESKKCGAEKICHPGAAAGDPLCLMTLKPGEETRTEKKACINKVKNIFAACAIGKVCNPSGDDAAKLCVDNTKVLGPGEVVDGDRKLCIGSKEEPPISKECEADKACKPFADDANNLCVAKANVLKPGEKGGADKKCFGKIKKEVCGADKACNPNGETLCIDLDTLVKHGEEAKDAKINCVGRIGFQVCNATNVCDASAPSGNMCLPKDTVLSKDGKTSGKKVWCIATNGITRSKKCTGDELCKPGTDELCKAPVDKKTCESVTFECSEGKVKDPTKNTTKCENETACKEKCCKDKTAALQSRTGPVGISATDIILFSLFGVLLSCVCLTFCRLYCVGG